MAAIRVSLDGLERTKKGLSYVTTAIIETDKITERIKTLVATNSYKFSHE